MFKKHFFIHPGNFLMGVGSVFFMLNVHADVITTGNIFPGSLTTSPTTTSQVIIGFGGVQSSLVVNADTVSNGITAVNANNTGSIGVVAGFSSGDQGSILVKGNGLSGSARLSSINDIELGISGSKGILQIQNGGVVETTGQTAFSGSSVVAGNSDSVGEIVVTDPGSLLSTTGRVRLGGFSNSNGAMVISHGGRVQTAGTVAQDVQIEIGTGDGATGSALVRDANSSLVTNGIIVGGGSAGSTASNLGILSIQLGGTASTNPLASGEAGGLSIGSASPFGAEVIVRGAGSSLEVGAITSASNILAGKEVLVGGFRDGTLLVDNFGRVNASGANIIVGGGVSGTDTAAPGRLTVRSGGVVLANNVTINPNAVLNGDGTITANVTLNGGTVAPGNSPGTLTIDGDFTQVAGNLVIEIAGTGAGEFDVLNVLGAASFDPGTTIDLDFINGFAPTTGDVFDFLQTNTLASDMSLVNFAVLGLDPGFQFDTAFTSTGVFSMTALNTGVSSVPVPAALWLFVSGLSGLAGISGRKQKRREI